MSVDTRNDSRDSLFMFADVAMAGRADRVRVKVRNLSEGGMMAEGALEVATGDRLVVALRNVGDVNGTIAWVQGNRFGIAFAAPIDPRKAREPLSDSATEAPRYARPDLSAGMFGADPRRLRPL